LRSWNQLKNRDFDIVRWDDRGVNDYVARRENAELKTLVARARNYGEASDILRMAIIYSHGGFYVDWDVLLVDPDKFVALMPDLEKTTCILLRDRLTKNPDAACVYDNSFFYMKKENPLALDFLREIRRNYSKDPVPNTPYLTGPLALTKFLDARPDYRDACTMLEELDLYAFDYQGVQTRTNEDAMQRTVLRDYYQPGSAPAIHFWMHTWTPAPKPTWSAHISGVLRKMLRITIST
jgi:hypothetical protein